MDEDLVLGELIPTRSYDRKKLSSFLQKHGLKYEKDIDYAVVFYEGEKLVACGCSAGALLKGFAVDEELRGENLLGRIISVLIANRFSMGFFDLVVITAPHNKKLFNNSGFYTIAETKDLVFLEQRPDGVQRFYSDMQHREDKGKTAGAIVVNCNPFTLGHRYLIEYATRRCDVLYIFVVQEEQSAFPFDIRFKLVKEGVADLSNVRVHRGGSYIISSATFPTYFLKQEDDAVKMQAELDAKTFATRIAPALSIKTRFVGSEPMCPVTSQYNRVMHNVLPAAGIEIVEVPRHMTADGTVISASRVRSLLAEGVLSTELLRLVPNTTYQYLLSTDAIPIIEALKQHNSKN